jgi:hypothetical protein
MLVSLALAVVLAVGAAPTKVEHWSAAGAHVVQSGSGYCWTGSIADQRTDAWRCFLGKNEIVDPCFSGGGSTVLCPDGTPDSHDAIRIKLTKGLPRGQANHGNGATPGAPWAIVTAGGAYCYRVTGATDERLGRALTYECAGASALAGSPNRTRRVWTVSLLPTSTSQHFVTTDVRAAWW